MIPLSYNIRNLRVRRATTLATALGVALVVFVLAAALMLAAGIERTMAASGDPSTAIVLRKGSDAELSSAIEDKLVGIITAAPGVGKNAEGAPNSVAELVIVMYMDKVDGSGSSNVLLRGVSDNVLEFRPEVKLVEGRAPKPGTDEIMVGKAVAGRFENLELGKTIELRKNRPAQVVGVFEADGSSFESEVWGDLYVVRGAFGRDGVVSSVRVRLADAAVFDGFEAAVEQDQRLQLDAKLETDFYKEQSEGTAMFLGAIGVVITVFFSVGAMIGATITMYGAVSQRASELGVLRAIGFSRTAVMASFLFESVLLALLGGLIGAGASLLLGMVEFSLLNFTTFSEIVFKFQPTPGIVVAALVCGGVMGVIGGFLPAIRASRVSPIEAMRG